MSAQVFVNSVYWLVQCFTLLFALWTWHSTKHKIRPPPVLLPSSSTTGTGCHEYPRVETQCREKESSSGWQIQLVWRAAQASRPSSFFVPPAPLPSCGDNRPQKAKLPSLELRVVGCVYVCMHIFELSFHCPLGSATFGKSLWDSTISSVPLRL